MLLVIVLIQRKKRECKRCYIHKKYKEKRRAIIDRLERFSYKHYAAIIHKKKDKNQPFAGNEFVIQIKTYLSANELIKTHVVLLRNNKR